MTGFWEASAGQAATYAATAHECIARDAKQRRGVSKLEALMESNSAKTLHSLPGFQVYTNLIYTLKSFGVRRSAMQMEFHDYMIAAALPTIFGADFAVRGRLIMAHFSLGRLRQWLLIFTPRREGKTWCLGMFMAAMMRVGHEVTMMAFSAGARAAQVLQRLVVNFYKQTREAVARILIENKETLMVCSPAPFAHFRNESNVVAPADDKSRGTGGKLVIADEYSFLKEKLLYESIFPMMLRSNSAAIFISSPPTDANSMKSGLANLKNQDTGELLFDVKRIRRVCQDCEQKDLIQCQHALADRPAWKSEARERMVAQLYGAGHETQRNREVLGLEQSDSTDAFQRALVLKAFNERERVLFHDKVSHVFIAIDPSGGGFQSNTSFIAAAFDINRRLVILGGHDFSAVGFTTIKQYTAFDHFMRQLRSRPAFSTSVVVLIPENNNDNVATRDWCLAAGIYRPLVVYGQHVKEPARWGVRTTDYTKERMVHHMRMLLSTDSLLLYKYPIAVQTDGDDNVDFFDKLRDQLTWFAEHKIAPGGGLHSELFNDFKSKFTGKGHGRKDDAVMSLLIVAYYAPEYLRDALMVAVSPDAPDEIITDLVAARTDIVHGYIVS